MRVTRKALYFLEVYDIFREISENFDGRFHLPIKFLDLVLNAEPRPLSPPLRRPPSLRGGPAASRRWRAPRAPPGEDQAETNVEKYRLAGEVGSFCSLPSSTTL